MNYATFQGFLTPFWQSWAVADLSDAADKIATAYHISNIGQTTTPFGAPLISGDRESLKLFIDLGLKINFYGGQIQSQISSISKYALGAIDSFNRGSTAEISVFQRGALKQVSSLVSGLPSPLAFIGPIISGLVKEIFDGILGAATKVPPGIVSLIKKLKGIVDILDVSTIAYGCMSIGFCLYWATAQFSPMPPMPPCIAPSPGIQILFPGAPIPLNSDLKDTFSGGQSVPDAVRKLYNSSIAHQFTIAGLYIGLVPSPIGPVGPVPIPWFSLINAPIPNPKPSSLIDSNKDSIIDKTKFSERVKTTTINLEGQSPTSNEDELKPRTVPDTKLSEDQIKKSKEEQDRKEREEKERIEEENKRRSSESAEQERQRKEKEQQEAARKESERIERERIAAEEKAAADKKAAEEAARRSQQTPKKKTLNGNHGIFYTSDKDVNAPFIMVYGGIKVRDKGPDSYMLDYFTPAKTSGYNIYNRNNSDSGAAKAGFDEAKKFLQNNGINPRKKILYCFSGGNGGGCNKILKDSVDYWDKVYFVGPYLGGGNYGESIVNNYVSAIQKNPSKFFISTVGGTSNAGDAGITGKDKLDRCLVQKKKLINAIPSDRVLVGTNHMTQNKAVVDKLISENPV